jgi:hypothetical protein
MQGREISCFVDAMTLKVRCTQQVFLMLLCQVHEWMRERERGTWTCLITGFQRQFHNPCYNKGAYPTSRRLIDV